MSNVNKNSAGNLEEGNQSEIYRLALINRKNTIKNKCAWCNEENVNVFGWIKELSKNKT